MREIFADPTARVQARVVRGSLVMVLADLHHDPRGFHRVTGIMGAAVVAVLLLLRRRRIF